MIETSSSFEGSLPEIPSDKDSKNIESIITANTRLDSCLRILGTVNFDIIKYLIDQTPPELQNSISYHYFVAAKEFSDKLQEINQKFAPDDQF